MTEMFIELAAKVIFTLLITLIGVAGTWLTAQISKRNELVNISAATDEATKTAQRVVLELQQTMVEGCRDALLKMIEAEPFGDGKTVPYYLQ